MVIKKKSWLSKLKRFFFISETHSKPEKERKRKWLLKRQHINELASITPPPLPPLPSPPQLVLHVKEKKQDEAEDLHRKIQELAAIKIQTAFRGHLARKALRALKGLVRLQAIIRGRNVRRKAINTLKCLQSIVNIQRRVCQRRTQSFEENNFEFHEKIESSNQRRWDDSILTQKEAKTLFLNKKEAVIKRERIKEYALGHRNSTDHENGRANENLRSWLEVWVDKQLARRADHKDSNILMSHSPSRSKDIGRKKLHYATNHQKHRLEGLVSPKYMAPTESAKAKARSNSSPRIRTLSFDTYSEQNNSPYKNKLSDTSSVVTSEKVSNSSARMRSEFHGFHCKSPSLKGVSAAVKSRRTVKDFSFDSECSLMNWDRYGLFK